MIISVHLITVNSDDALTIEDPLYVCIKSVADDIVVNKITLFTIRKGGDVGYNTVQNGERDFNMFVKDVGKSVVQVETHPQASLFEDNRNIIIQGSAVLGSATNSACYLARFMQELNSGSVTTNYSEMEVERIKAVYGANAAMGSNFVVYYGTMIGIVITTSFFF